MLNTASSQRALDDSIYLCEQLNRFGDFQGLENEARAGLEIPGIPNEDKALFHLSLVTALNGQGKWKKANRAAEIAIKSSRGISTEDKAELYRGMTVALVQLERYSQAERVAEVGLQLAGKNSDLTEFYVSVVSHLNDEGKYREAKSMANIQVRAIQGMKETKQLWKEISRSESVLRRLDRVKSLNKEGKPQEAIREANAQLKTIEASGKAHLYLEIAHSKAIARQYAGAIKAAEMGLKYVAGNKQLKRKLSRNLRTIKALAAKVESPTRDSLRREAIWNASDGSMCYPSDMRPIISIIQECHSIIQECRLLEKGRDFKELEKMAEKGLDLENSSTDQKFQLYGYLAKALIGQKRFSEAAKSALGGLHLTDISDNQLGELYAYAAEALISDDDFSTASFYLDAALQLNVSDSLRRTLEQHRDKAEKGSEEVLKELHLSMSKETRPQSPKEDELEQIGLGELSISASPTSIMGSPSPDARAETPDRAIRLPEVALGEELA